MPTTCTAAVLYVEDDFYIREYMGEVLSDAGFNVVIAANGAAAYDALDENVEPFRIIVTDVNLGAGPNGWDVARHARSTNGAMCVIYVSGAFGPERRLNCVTNSMMIVKPFTPTQIVGAMDSLLRHRPDR